MKVWCGVVVQSRVMVILGRLFSRRCFVSWRGDDYILEVRLLISLEGMSNYQV